MEVLLGKLEICASMSFPFGLRMRNVWSNVFRCQAMCLCVQDCSSHGDSAHLKCTQPAIHYL